MRVKDPDAHAGILAGQGFGCAVELGFAAKEEAYMTHWMPCLP